VDSSWRRDIYLTISAVSGSGKGPASIGVVDQPMVEWLWVGGVLTAFGALLAAVPSGRKRRRTSQHSDESTALKASTGGEDSAGGSGSSAGLGSNGHVPAPAAEDERPARHPVGVGE
jgi:hypothetical protein